MKASTYELLIDIETSIDIIVRHLLSMIYASLEAAWLLVRRLLPDYECVNLDIFESALEFPKAISLN